MNSFEAKFILEACRPGDLDTSDPMIAEALRAMDSDPELAEWFAMSQECDRQVVSKLKALPVPSDLAEKIRAGKSVASRTSGRWSRRPWLALAALLLVLLAIGSFLIPRKSSTDFVTFRNEMADFMDRRWDKTLDQYNPELAKLRQWIESRADAIKIDVPLTLAAGRTIGCKTVRWRGHTAALICFWPNNTGTVVHVLAVNQRALTNVPGAKPELAKLTNWNSAIWTRGETVYLALTTADSEKLSGCL